MLEENRLMYATLVSVLLQWDKEQTTLPRDIVEILKITPLKELKTLYDPSGFRFFKYVYDRLKYSNNLKNLYVICITYCPYMFQTYYMVKCGLTQKDILTVMNN